MSWSNNRQNPETRHLPRGMLILFAISEAWCQDYDPMVTSRIPEWKKVPAPVPVKKPAKPLPLDTE
jgi:hypothetical protein